jgi:hypothetical protein
MIKDIITYSEGARESLAGGGGGSGSISRLKRIVVLDVSRVPEVSRREGSLRKRATCARRAIRQATETLAGLGPLPAEWPHLSAETADLVAAIRKARTSDDLALVVKGPESRKDQAEAWLREVRLPVEIGPEGPVNEPHNIYKQTD